MIAGVRHCCPLSPLLYAVCADLLIERIRHKLPSAVVRAYADDTAVLVQNLWTDIPILARIFNDFGNMANLRRNLSKTVVIPLFLTTKLSISQSDPHTVRARLVVCAIVVRRTLLGLRPRP